MLTLTRETGLEFGDWVAVNDDSGPVIQIGRELVGGQHIWVVFDTDHKTGGNTIRAALDNYLAADPAVVKVYVPAIREQVFRISEEAEALFNVITTADGQKAYVGDAVFNYYDMRRVVIDSEPDDQGWFNCIVPGCHGKDYLNGQRICSLAHARRMGWLR